MTRPDGGLQAERTVLSWSRTGVALAAVGLLLVRDPIGRSGPVLAAVALLLAAAAGLVSRRRRVVVGRRTGSAVAPASREVAVLGLAVTALAAAVGVAVLVG